MILCSYYPSFTPTAFLFLSDYWRTVRLGQISLQMEYSVKIKIQEQYHLVFSFCLLATTTHVLLGHLESLGQRPGSNISLFRVEFITKSYIVVNFIFDLINFAFRDSLRDTNTIKDIFNETLTLQL